MPSTVDDLKHRIEERQKVKAFAPKDQLDIDSDEGGPVWDPENVSVMNPDAYDRPQLPRLSAPVRGMDCIIEPVVEDEY